MNELLTIHSINPTGMFSFGKCENYVLRNKGLVHLLGVNEDKGGDSNGSGKSSMFNALCEILFGENPTGEKSDAIINSVWNKGMAGRVLFTNWQGDHYRVTYTRKWKEQLYPVDNDRNVAYVGTSLFLEKHEDGVWLDARGSGMPDTRKKLLEILGITYERFLAIAYMSHRIGNQFLRGTNKDRMDILSGITGIEEWDKILDRCRKRKKSLNIQISDLDQKASFERGSVQTLQEQLQSAQAFDWDQHVKSLEGQLGAARQDWAKTDQSIKDLNAKIAELVADQAKSYDQEKIGVLNKEIEDLNEDLRRSELALSRPFDIQEDTELRLRLTQLLSDLSQLRGNYNALENNDSKAPIATPPELDKVLQESLTTKSQAEGSLNALLGESGNLLSMVECPTCGSEVSEDKKAKIHEKMETFKAKIESAGRAYQTHQVELEAYKEEQWAELERQKATQLDELQAQMVTLETKQSKIERDMGADKARKIAKADEERSAITLRITGLRGQIQGIRNNLQAESEAYQSFDTTIRTEQAKLPALQQELSDHHSKGVAIKAQIEQAQVSIENIKALEAQIEEKGRHVKFFDDEIAQVSAELDVYLWLINNIPAIKLHKMSVSMAEISDLVNEYFNDMGDSLRVSITSFEEKSKKKNAADIKDLMKSEVKIEVTDGVKNISPKLYSDGEVSKISLAIIRALHEMARKSGQGCNIMMMDEIFSFVDSNNSQRIADSLGKLMKRGTVFLTDNSGMLNDLITFDNVWTARKSNGQTQIEVK